ncbi:MAG: hypothetical protein QOI95_3284 [Acidimicrobiaceae bacterium]|jgi:hypothetical protein
MTKRLRTALLGVVFVGALGLTACDSSAQADTSVAQDAITQAFGPLADQAMGVAQCESTLNPDAVSSGGGNWGLFQINTVHRSDFEAVTGHSWDEILDPYLNSTYAKYLYDQSGWSPWACRWAA